ncbi:MAG TPA: outer membrane protein assembly factor BamD [Bryobacteraceae bacterium]|nr:outer membrane protein assembly factor BamD [Bryobacteraceae bacterium]
MVRISIRFAAVLAALAALAIAPGCRRKAYENPITKDTQQPDKVLFDRAIDDIEHGRFERGRLTLQTLMNTYDTSEYLAKAKLAYADSWYREGGAHGFAQAEAEYKDFILFYPQMEEAAEAQEKICKMQYQQMDKADRDPLHARRAEDECKQLLVQFPNSKFAPQAKQYLLDVQEVLADEEFKVGSFYHNAKGSYPAASNRLQALTDQYPLYSQADEALMMLGDSYHRMGDNFENQEASAYSKVVKDYPLSPHVAEATARLKAMSRPVPEADPVAYAREKYELENRRKRSLIGKAWGPFAGHPNTLTAAQSGSPNMDTFKPSVPASVPANPSGETGTTGVSVGGESGVTSSVVKDTSLIDNSPDARLNRSGAAAGTSGAAGDSGAKPAAGSSAGAAGAPAPAASGSAAAPANSTTPATTTPATTPRPQALPQNHTGKTKAMTPAQQLKVAQKQQTQMKKMQDQQAKTKKRQEEDQAKKDKKKKKDTPPPAATPSTPASSGASGNGPAQPAKP